MSIKEDAIGSLLFFLVEFRLFFFFFNNMTPRKILLSLSVNLFAINVTSKSCEDYFILTKWLQHTTDTSESIN